MSAKTPSEVRRLRTPTNETWWDTVHNTSRGERCFFYFRQLKNWCFWTVLLETLESPLDCKEIQPVHPKGNQNWIFHWKDWCWSWSCNTLATWCEELTHWKRPWFWEKLKAGGEGDDRRRDGWMASPTWWTLVWASSGSWWWTEKPGILQSVHGVTKSWTWLSDWTDLKLSPRWVTGKESTCQCKRHGFDPRVGKIPWNRKWQPTPAFLPEKSHGQRSLVGYIQSMGSQRFRSDLVI